MRTEKYLLLTFAVLCAELLVAQPQASQRIIYRMEHVRFKEKPTERYTEEFSLYISGSTWLFKSRTREKGDSLNAEALQRTMRNSGEELVLSGKPSSKESILIDSKMQKAWKGLRIRPQDYIIELPFPQVPWQKIQNEKKMILGHVCLKAKGVWGGRTYTVWYAPSLGSNAGPWKLHGLPGLILEAFDTHKEVVFTATGIQPLRQPMLVALPKKSIVATNQEITRLLSAGTNGSGGGSDVKISGIKIEGGDGKSGTSNRNIQITNPLELQ